MKIGETQPIGAIQPSQAARRYARRGAGAAAAASDTASVMGIPEHELSPKVQAALSALMAEVDSLRQEIEQSSKRIEYLERLADEDSMVPVANRRAFVRELSRMMSFSQRYGQAGSVLFFDVNGLKRINDTLGHAAGDAAIAHVAKVLSDQVRESDLVGRLGGDEFGLILAQADQAQADQKAAQLAQAITDTPLDWEGKQITLTISHGAQTFQGEDAGAALDAADRKMYAQKRGGSETDNGAADGAAEQAIDHGAVDDGADVAPAAETRTGTATNTGTDTKAVTGTGAGSSD